MLDRLKERTGCTAVDCFLLPERLTLILCSRGGTATFAGSPSVFLERLQQDRGIEDVVDSKRGTRSWT